MKVGDPVCVIRKDDEFFDKLGRVREINNPTSTTGDVWVVDFPGEVDPGGYFNGELRLADEDEVRALELLEL